MSPLIPPSTCPLSGRVFSPLGHGLQTLALSLMIGGMLALGAFTAPAVFGHFPRQEAAPVMALIFRRYDTVLLIALCLLWLGEWLRVRTPGYCQSGRLPLVRYGLMLALSGSLLCSTLVLNPEIARMNQEGLHRDWTTSAGRHFEQTHQQSESLYKLALLLAVLVGLLTPFVSRTTVPATPQTGETPC